MMEGRIQYPYAYDENGNLVFIGDVDIEGRDAHQYRCPECGRPMKPRLGPNRAKHFYHCDNQSCDVESYLHKTAKYILAERLNNKAVPLIIKLSPERLCEKYDFCPMARLDCRCNPEEMEYDLARYYDLPAEIEVSLREPEGDVRFRPDVLLRSSDPRREDIYLEVCYKSPSNPGKIQSGHRIIEIVVRHLGDLEKLKTIERLEEGKDIKFYNFISKVSPEGIVRWKQELAHDCGTYLPPDALPPCLLDEASVTRLIPCPKCGGKLVLRKGQYNDFYGCSNYPECRYTYTVYKH